MPVYGATSEHDNVVKLLYYAGFFLLFCSLGTFGSAGLINYKATKWPETTAQIQSCSLGQYGPVDNGMLYALNCDISYRYSGRSYKTMLLTRMTRSVQERSAINNWIADNRRGTTLSIRVNPSYADEFVVLSPLPGQYGENAGDFNNAAILIGSLSFVLLTTARVLVRRGW